MGIVQDITTLPETIRYAGYRITAPGFDELTFAAAIDRALSDGLTVRPARAPKTFLVTNPATRGEYVVNHHGCSCPAGLHGSPCKHAAIVLLVETIIESRV